METRANYVLIGLFTIAAIFGAAGFVYWFQHGGQGADRATYRVVFDNAVSGLRTGSAVLFNGIRVGEVTALGLDQSNPNQVVATVEVARSTPIRRDTLIGLDFQGLTGIASLSLRGGSSSQPILVSQKGELPTLRADPRMSQDVLQSAREVLAKIDKLVADNEAALGASLRNIETVTATLARNSDSFDRSLKNIEAISATLARNAEPFDRSMKNVEAITSTLARNSDSFDRSMKNIETVTGTFAKNSDKFDRIIAGLDNLTGGPEGKGEIQQAARSIRQLADNLDKRTADITAGINRFSATGAREFETLSGDAKRTLATLERTLRNFDRNPSRLIWGGSGGGGNVPEYNGRR